MNISNKQLIISIFLVTILILFGTFVWPTRYQYKTLWMELSGTATVYLNTDYGKKVTTHGDEGARN
jgi:hypothetical protein